MQSWFTSSKCSVKIYIFTIKFIWINPISERFCCALLVVVSGFLFLHEFTRKSPTGNFWKCVLCFWCRSKLYTQQDIYFATSGLVTLVKVSRQKPPPLFSHQTSPTWSFDPRIAEVKNPQFRFPHQQFSENWTQIKRKKKNLVKCLQSLGATTGEDHVAEAPAESADEADKTLHWHTHMHSAAPESRSAPTLPSKKKKRGWKTRWNLFLPLIHNPPPPPSSFLHQVRYLKIIEKSGYQALPWVRYITQNGGKVTSWRRMVVQSALRAVIGQQLGNAVQYGGNGPCSDAVPWKGDTM